MLLPTSFRGGQPLLPAAPPLAGPLASPLVALGSAPSFSSALLGQALVSASDRVTAKPHPLLSYTSPPSPLSRARPSPRQNGQQILNPPTLTVSLADPAPLPLAHKVYLSTLGIGFSNPVLGIGVLAETQL